MSETPTTDPPTDAPEPTRVYCDDPRVHQALRSLRTIASSALDATVHERAAKMAQLRGVGIDEPMLRRLYDIEPIAPDDDRHLQNITELHVRDPSPSSAPAPTQPPGSSNLRTLSEEEQARLNNNFRYHPPSDDQVGRMRVMRDRAGNLASLIARACPMSREASLAQTKLEEAVMWANAAIARNEPTAVTAAHPPSDDPNDMPGVPQ